MASTYQTAQQQKPPPPTSEELALTRTRLAHERTMMAWIRTSASMISFGFGIYKFFDYFQSDHQIHQGFVTPRRFAIFLISLGLIVLAGAAVQNWMDLRRLRQSGNVPISLAGVVGILMAILGLLGLVAAVRRE